MKTIFSILWFISLMVWGVYAIKTIKGEDEDSLIKMNIALIVMIIFNILLNIFK